jgi:hypothetical protein
MQLLLPPSSRATRCFSVPIPSSCSGGGVGVGTTGLESPTAGLNLEGLPNFRTLVLRDILSTGTDIGMHTDTVLAIPSRHQAHSRSLARPIQGSSIYLQSQEKTQHHTNSWDGWQGYGFYSSQSRHGQDRAGTGMGRRVNLWASRDAVPGAPDAIGGSSAHSGSIGGMHNSPPRPTTRS